MSVHVDEIIGGWIRKAEKTGELKNNPNNGKKFDFKEYFQTPKEHRVMMKVLKDANFLPPVVEMMKEIELKKEERSKIEDPEKREELRKEIITLELKRDVLLQRK